MKNIDEMDNLDARDELDRVVSIIAFLQDACLALFPYQSDVDRETSNGMFLTFDAARDRVEKVQQFLSDDLKGRKNHGK